MELTELVTAFPNLAFGLICLWFVQVVWKERVGELARYATSLEAVNKLYVDLLERAVVAIANNTSQSTDNGKALGKLAEEFAILRREFAVQREAVDRFIHDGAKRHPTDRGGTHSGAGTD